MFVVGQGHQGMETALNVVNFRLILIRRIDATQFFFHGYH
jgi:hypothetical protein